jgi:hypothetical protein
MYMYILECIAVQVAWPLTNLLEGLLLPAHGIEIIERVNALERHPMKPGIQAII